MIDSFNLTEAFKNAATFLGLDQQPPCFGQVTKGLFYSIILCSEGAMIGCCSNMIRYENKFHKSFVSNVIFHTLDDKWAVSKNRLTRIMTVLRVERKYLLTTLLLYFRDDSLVVARSLQRLSNYFALSKLVSHMGFTVFSDLQLFLNF